MLDQMQVTVPITTLFSSFPSLYVIGPIDPAHIALLHVQLSTGDVCPLMVPAHLPDVITTDPAFHDGYTYNYLSEEEDEEQEEWMGSVTRIVNHIYKTLTDHRLYHDLETGEVVQDFLPWKVGWLLRDLTRLAETDHTLASVGMAHLCFVLPLLIWDRPATWPRYVPYHSHSLHLHAVKAYRAAVQVYREQGKSFAEAERLALVGPVC